MTEPRDVSNQLVSILIPVRDDLPGLAITLASVKAALDGDTAVEVIVCNDGGGPKISALARRHGCREVILNENCGSYAARNAGLQAARGQAIAFLDADERIHPEWLAAGRQALRNADYVGGQIVVDVSPEATAWQRSDGLTAFPVPHYMSVFHFAPTANLFVWRSVFERIGCFEESLQSGGDREFGVRVYRANMRQAYCEAAVVYHPARGLRQQLAKQARIARGVVELELLIWRNPPAGLIADTFRQLLKVPIRTAIMALRVLWTTRRTEWREQWMMVVCKAFTTFVHDLARMAHAVALIARRKRAPFSGDIRKLQPIDTRQP